MEEPGGLLSMGSHRVGHDWSDLAAVVKNSAANAGDIRFLGWEDPLEEGMAIQSSILAFRIPWTEELCRLQSMGLQRVWHVWCYLAAPRAISRGEVFHQFILPLTEIHLKNTKTPFFFSSYGGMIFFQEAWFFFLIASETLKEYTNCSYQCSKILLWKNYRTVERITSSYPVQVKTQ